MTRTAVATHTLQGDWMQDGYLCDLAPRICDIEIESGRPYEMDDYGHRLFELSLDADGSLCGWGAVTFAPDAGELRRVGLVT